MARFTTDFLTWLKGLFYTETEIDNLLENKLNTSEVQAHVTQFTNKDRINIDRLMRYMDNDGASDFYTLKLTGSSDTIDTINTTENTVEADGEKLPAETEQYINLYAQILKDDTVQTGRTDTVTFKLTDGTVLGTSKVNTGTTTGLVVPNSIYLSLGNALESDIYYCYAEVTIAGSVIKSNIFTLFVKENQNRINHNLWSGTDYENNLNGTVAYSGKLNVEPSNNWSDIGETSIRYESTKDEYQGITLYKNYVNTGEVATANITILHPTGKQFYIRLYEKSEILTDIAVPENNKPINIQISRTVTIGEELSLTIFTRKTNNKAYIDNIRLTIT